MSDSKILSQLKVDDPIAIDATYRPNDADRRYIDDQVRGLETLVVDSLVSGAICSWPLLSTSSVGVSTGDVVCLSGEAAVNGAPVVTLASAAAFSAIGAVYGIVLSGGAPGSRIRVAVGGAIPAGVIPFGGITGFAVLNELGKVSIVPVVTTETQLGIVDTSGGMQFKENISGGGGGGGGTTEGKVVKAMANADATLTSLEVLLGSVRTTGAHTAERNLFVPVPVNEAASYRILVYNDTTGGYNIEVRLVGSTGTFVSIRPGTKDLLEVTPTGIISVTGGFYDPIDFGVIPDGKTDNLDQLNAMIDKIAATGAPSPIVRMPVGQIWCRDRWVINRGCQIIFNGNQSEAGMLFPQGKSGIVLDGSSTPFADSACLYRPYIQGSGLVHPSANGATPWGCAVYSIGGTVRRNEVFVKTGGTDPTYGFRATSMTANGGRGPATMPSGLEANWITTVGATYTDSNGTTWTTERLLDTTYMDDTRRGGTVVVTPGRRWLADRSHVYMFEATVGGTLAATAPSRELGYRSQGTNVIGDTFADGAATVKAVLCAGIYIHSTYAKVVRPNVIGFQGPQIYAVGGNGYDTELGNGFCDGWSLEGPAQFTYGGMGVFTGGDDGNGFYVDGGIWGNALGCYLPTPNLGVAAYSALEPGEVGGGHLWHDCSEAGGYIGGLYSQTSGGYPVLRNGTGSLTLVSCYSENGKSYCNSAGSCYVIGGTLTFTEDSVNVVSPNIDHGRGITQRVNTTDTPYSTRILNLVRRDNRNSRLLEMSATRTPADSNRLGWLFNSDYNAANRWTFNHGTSTNRNVFSVTGVGVGINPGAGWLEFDDGYLDTTNGLYRGPFTMIDVARLRGGLRKAGDEFSDGAEKVIVLESATDAAATPASAPAAHGHVSWNAVVSLSPDYPDDGFAGTRIEPTATFGKTNSKVFKLVSGDTKGTPEPDWSSAVNAGDQINDNAGGGNIVWELVGYRPPLSRQEWTTTTNAANQVIAEVTIPPDGTYTVFAQVNGDVGSTGKGFAGTILGVFKRNGTAAPVQLGTTDLVLKKEATLAINTSTGLDLSIDSTLHRVRVRISPGETITYKGRVRIEVSGVSQ